MKHIFASLTITLAIIATIAFSAPVSAAGINGNPWNYSFVAAHGSLIYAVPAGFCGQYFHCIPNFPNGKGYVVECKDGMYSKSGGKTGSCSGRHGGNLRALYAHESSETSSSPAQPVTSGNSTTAPSLPLTGSDPYVVLYVH